MAKRLPHVLVVAVFTTCLMSIAARADPVKRPPGQASALAGQTGGPGPAKQGQAGRPVQTSPGSGAREPNKGSQQAQGSQNASAEQPPPHGRDKVAPPGTNLRAQNDANKNSAAGRPDPKHKNTGARASQAAQPKGETTNQSPPGARSRTAAPAKRASGRTLR